MRSHPKDQMSRQKKLPLTLKTPGPSKILTDEPEFPIDTVVRVASDLGFRQIIPPPLGEPDLFRDDPQLLKEFNTKFFEVSGNLEKKFIFPPTYFLNVFAKYLEKIGEESRPISRWFYISPVVSIKDRRPFIEHELGLFILGEDSIIANAHLIDAVTETFKELGIANIILEMNSLGCKNCQGEYQSLLTDHFNKQSFNLCDECSENLQNGRLIMWSCQKQNCQELLASAPQMVDFLDDECRTNLIGVLEAVDILGIPYSLNPFLSGRISNNRIFFRIQTSANNVLGEGGNYGPWSIHLGQENQVPLLAFMTTLEKLLPFVPLEKQKAKPKVEVFLVSLGDMACKKALAMRKLLNISGVKTWESLLGRPGIKSQLKEAQEHGSEIALIIGQKEAMDETVILRDMRSGMQEIFSFDRIIEEVKKRLG